MDQLTELKLRKKDLAYEQYVHHTKRNNEIALIQTKYDTRYDSLLQEIEDVDAMIEMLELFSHTNQ